MTPDLYALSTLLRSLGLPAREVARRYNAAHPLAPLSTPTVESWMRPPGASRKPGRPRWDVLAGLADALNIPRADLYKACAGEAPAESVTTDPLPPGFVLPTGFTLSPVDSAMCGGKGPDFCRKGASCRKHNGCVYFGGSSR